METVTLILTSRPDESNIIDKSDYLIKAVAKDIPNQPGSADSTVYAEGNSGNANGKTLGGTNQNTTQSTKSITFPVSNITVSTTSGYVLLYFSVVILCVVERILAKCYKTLNNKSGYNGYTNTFLCLVSFCILLVVRIALLLMLVSGDSIIFLLVILSMTMTQSAILLTDRLGVYNKSQNFQRKGRANHEKMRAVEYVNFSD